MSDEVFRSYMEKKYAAPDCGCMLARACPFHGDPRRPVDFDTSLKHDPVHEDLGTGRAARVHRVPMSEPKVIGALRRAVGEWTDEAAAIRAKPSPFPPRAAQQAAESNSIEADANLLDSLAEALAEEPWIICSAFSDEDSVNAGGYGSCAKYPDVAPCASCRLASLLTTEED